MNPLEKGGKKRVSVLAALGLLFAGALLLAGFNIAMDATNTLEFCISCHEMEQKVYQEYHRST
ncbi:MAG: NapC/NirT family cytochrome c, partial [Pseudomonadota bacterium]|nr:NapC/NirT family cytochrome c [Pseudomonadota bacterium]